MAFGVGVGVSVSAAAVGALVALDGAGKRTEEALGLVTASYRHVVDDAAATLRLRASLALTGVGRAG